MESGSCSGTAENAGQNFGFSGTLTWTNSNATDSSPFLALYYYVNDPGTFQVSGTVFAAQQSYLTDQPMMMVNQQFFEDFGIGETGTLNFSTSKPFTCTVYDNNTLVGTATAMPTAGTSGSGPTGEAACYFGTPKISVASDAAFVVTPTANYNAMDLYTILLSQ